MKIRSLEEEFFVDGDNDTKTLEIEVETALQSFNVYLYFRPVKGKTTYVTEDPLSLVDGKALYQVPGVVCDGNGYFNVQAVARKDQKVAKSKVESFHCFEKIDDSSAVTPTGRVITLIDIAERLDDLTASEVAYVDTEGIGAGNVQDALDYALTHGGGSSRPVYTLRWSENPNDFRETNFTVIGAIRNLEIGSYDLLLQYGSTTTRKTEAYEIQTGSTVTVWFRGSWDGESDRIYKISCGTTQQSYTQTKYVIPDSEFDPNSLAAPSMFATAGYIDERIGTTGNLNPSSYASASDVSAIEAKIPSAASAQNQLADRNFVNSSISTNTAYFIGTFDSVAELEAYSGTVTNNDYALVTTKNGEGVVTAYNRYKYNAGTQEWLFEYTLNTTGLTSDQVAAINSGITSSKVTAYDTHVADTTIHVTAANKTYWNAKYTKPAQGIPATDLAQGVQTSLGLADTALQSVPSGYATESYVDTAIATAIGDAIGGSY